MHGARAVACLDAAVEQHVVLSRFQLLARRPEDAGPFRRVWAGGDHGKEDLAHLGAQGVLLLQRLADLLVELVENEAQVSAVGPGVEVERPVERLAKARFKLPLVDHRRRQIAGLLVRQYGCGGSSVGYSPSVGWACRGLALLMLTSRGCAAQSSRNDGTRLLCEAAATFWKT